MPPCFIIISESDGVLMDGGNVNLLDIPPLYKQGLTSYLIPKYLPDSPVEKDKVKQAADCCRKILNHVNQAVKESEDKQVRFENLSLLLPCFSLIFLTTCCALKTVASLYLYINPVLNSSCSPSRGWKTIREDWTFPP